MDELETQLGELSVRERDFTRGYSRDVCFTEDRESVRDQSETMHANGRRECQEDSDEDDGQTVRQVDFEKFRAAVNVCKVNIKDFFPEWRDSTDESGASSSTDESAAILKRTIRLGEGERVAQSSFVRYRYAAYLNKASVPFDSTKLRGDRIECVRLGQGMLLPGLEIALCTMRKGEFATFLVHYSLAYGELGIPPRIPPRSTIWFEVSLVSFGTGITVDEFATLIEDEPSRFQIDDFTRMTCEERAEACALFRVGDYRAALTRYAKLVQVHERTLARATCNSQGALERTLVQLLVNVALCFSKLNEHDRARSFARRALAVEPRSAKAHFRLATALQALGDFEEAARSFNRALELAPNSAEIVEALRSLNRSRGVLNERDRAMCIRMCEVDLSGDFAKKPLAEVNETVKDLNRNESDRRLDFERRLNFLVAEQPQDAYVEYPLAALSDAQRESLDEALDSVRLKGRLVRTNVERNGRVVVHIAKRSLE